VFEVFPDLADVEESWNRGMNLVNDVNNIYNTLNHRYSLSADNRNQNVQRISELNYLRETRSNTMGRYVMLTFKYRLNKMAREGGIKVDMHKRR
jgi:hypothetical protein